MCRRPTCLVADESWSFEPELDVRRYADLYGNPCLRTVLPAGRSVLRYAAVATVRDAIDDADPDAPESPVADLPDDVLLYTLPSRYCLPDMLGDEAWKRFADIPPGYSRVQAICDHVHEHLTFQYGQHGDLDGRSTCQRPGSGSAATSPTWRSRSAGR